MMENQKSPIISPYALPEYVTRQVKKYTGKKAKIEAISRFERINLPLDMPLKQVNEYININYFGKPAWHKYHDIFKEVAGELDVKAIKCTFQYDLQVLLEDGSNPEDIAVIKILIDKITNYKAKVYSPVLSVKRL